MRRFRLIVVPVVLVMIAARLHRREEGGDGDGGGEDTGTVNVLNAMEPRRTRFSRRSSTT